MSKLRREGGGGDGAAALCVCFYAYHRGRHFHVAARRIYAKAIAATAAATACPLPQANSREGVRWMRIARDKKRNEYCFSALKIGDGGDVKVKKKRTE